MDKPGLPCGSGSYGCYGHRFIAVLPGPLTQTSVPQVPDKRTKFRSGCATKVISSPVAAGLSRNQLRPVSGSPLFLTTSCPVDCGGSLT